MSVYINTDSVIHFSLPKSNSCLFAATLLKQFYHKRISSILCKEKHNSNEFSAFLSEFWVLLFFWWYCGSDPFLTFPVLVTCISNWSLYGSTYGYLFTVPAGQRQANSLAKITKTTRSPLALLMHFLLSTIEVKKSYINAETLRLIYLNRHTAQLLLLGESWKRESKHCTEGFAGRGTRAFANVPIQHNSK